MADEIHEMNSEDGHDPVDRPRPLLEHLEELRTCVMRCLVSWAACALVMLPLAPLVMRWLKKPLVQASELPALQAQGLTLESGLHFIMRLMLWGGMIVSLPLLIFFIARFVFPGLRRKERRWVGGVLVTAGIFFIAGIITGYLYVLPVAIKVLIEINHWVGLDVSLLKFEDYTKFAFETMMAFGLAFELPLLLLILGWIGLISANFLREKRRHAIVIIAFISMILAPPDAISMLVMMVPLCLIYELCIWLIRLREVIRGRENEQTQA